MRKWVRRKGRLINHGICGAVAAVCAHRCVCMHCPHCPAEDLHHLSLAGCAIIDAIKMDELQPGCSDWGHKANHQVCIWFRITWKWPGLVRKVHFTSRELFRLISNLTSATYGQKESGLALFWQQCEHYWSWVRFWSMNVYSDFMGNYLEKPVWEKCDTSCSFLTTVKPLLEAYLDTGICNNDWNVLNQPNVVHWIPMISSSLFSSDTTVKDSVSQWLPGL